MPRSPSARRAAAAAAFGLALAATLLPPGGAARASGMAAEYGPEAEALFIEICTDEPGATPAACRRLAEALQARLGYEAFLDGARRGPAAFPAEVAALRAPAGTGAMAEVRGAALAAR
jgi:CTP:molybdopterin cytidylyltransferase MocA